MRAAVLPAGRPRLATAARPAAASVSQPARRRTLIARSEPEDARSAIDAGIAALDGGDAAGALDLFTRALSLPGRGIKRFRDKPAGVSDGEKQAALYNIACAHAKLGDVRAALEAVAGCLEAGYEDVATLRADPDLEAVRADPRFEGLIARLAPKGGGGGGGGLGGLFKGLFKG